MDSRIFSKEWLELLSQEQEHQMLQSIKKLDHQLHRLKTELF